MKNKTARTEIITGRIRLETLEAGRLVASLQCRTVSALMEHALELYILKNYPLAYAPGAKLSLSLHEAPTE